MSKAVGEQFNFQHRAGRYTLHGFANGRVDFLPAGAKDHDYRSDEQRADDDTRALRALEKREAALSMEERERLLKCSSCDGVKPMEYYMSGGPDNPVFLPLWSRVGHPTKCACCSKAEWKMWKQLYKQARQTITAPSKRRRGEVLRLYMLKHSRVGADI